MTQIPPEQQCVLDDCDRAARDTSHGGGLCETHHAQMVDGIEDPTLPDDEPTTEQSTNDVTGDYTSGDDSAYSPGEIDLDGVEPETYPEDLVEAGARWLLWQDSDGRKVPRNPQWGRSGRDGGYAFVGAKNSDAWFEFEAARDWIDHDDDLGLAYYLTAPDRSDWDDDPNYQSVDPERDVPEEPHVGLLDFDDIRDPETGEIAPDAAPLLDQLAGTFCEWSPSGTGAPALGGFRLPDDVQTLTIDLSSPEWPDAELELYPGRRYTTVTGDHIPGSASSTRDIQGIVDDILATFPGALEAAQASTPASRPDDFDAEPSTSKEALADIETTDDMQDVFDAIQHTGPSDIRLRSRVTNERSDGTKDLDPSWAQSKSGTRLAEVDDGWVYRKGMIGLDALQVIALEKGIITTETDYPSGEDFWTAVEALRDRGAHIPEYEAEPGAGDPVSTIPLEKLDALDEEQRTRAAAERDVDWPSTDDARDRVLEAVRNREDVVIDAPTGLGKSYTVATEPWLDHADVTGEQPVVHFSPTREARDTAAQHSREASCVTHAVLRGRKEACPVTHGIHDPSEEDDDTADIMMDRTPASEWFDAVCDGRGIPFSTAHAYLAEHNDQGIELPCSRGDDPCPAIGQWDGLPRTEDGNPAVDVDGFGPWGESVLAQLELVADDLFGFITDAQDITVAFPEMPIDLEEFYTLLDFPEYLAQHAASDARSNAGDPFEIDMWTLHSGATYALTHFFRGKEDDALDGYVRTANDILFNPDGTLEHVEQMYERQSEAEMDGDGQAGLASQVGLAQIEQVNESVREKVETFEEREAALRERFADIDN